MGKVDARWWKAEEAPHEQLVGLVDRIIEQDGAARRTWLDTMRAVYLDEPLSSDMQTGVDEVGYNLPDCRTPWPALRCGVDAVHSKIAKTHPRGMVETIDGDWEMQCRAELQTQWLDGECYELGIDEIGERVFLDCLIYGTGAIYVGEKHDEPMAERVYVGDLFVDPREELYDCVRSLYRARPMDVGVLCEMFPDKREQIEKAKRLEPTEGQALSGTTDELVLAVEAWRLADGPGKKGRHVIAVDGCTLVDDQVWEGKRFPFAFVHWSRDPRRFWGIGLVEQMLAPQAELNEIAATNSEARHLFVPQLHVEKLGEQGIQVEQLDNEVGRVYVRPAGTAPPTLLYPGAIFNDMAMLEELYIQRVFNLAGINKLDTQSEKPAGLNSGKAIANFADLTSERFAVANRSWERLFIDVCNLLRDVARAIVSGDASKAKKLTVMGGKEALASVSYSDGDMGDHPSRIRTFPVSKLSDSIAARLDEVEKMVNAQMIADMDDARELLDLPDLKRFNTIESAGRRLVRKLVDKALKHGEATSPDPYMPLPFFIRYGSLSANLAFEHGAPEGHVQALRDMVQAAIEMKATMAPPPAAAPPMGPALPPGMPPMPPTGGPAAPPPMGPPPMPPGLAVVPPAGA